MSTPEEKQTDPDMLEVSIHRGGGGKPSTIQLYHVPRQDNQTVLDIVSHIQHYIDPTLSYRFACRVGMCGSCAMMVNNEPRWTCRTHIDRVVENNKIEIAPLRNLPVVKDLVPDLDPFFDKWTKAEARHHPSATRHQPMHLQSPDTPERKRADANIECINCAVCYAACDTVTKQPDYLGPAALQRAWTLLNDAKDADKQAIWKAVSGSDGCHNCHSIGSCAHYCPNELNPMVAIAGLKQQTIRQAFSLTSLLEKFETK